MCIESDDAVFAVAFWEDEKRRLEGRGSEIEFTHRGITSKAEWSDGMDQESKDVGYHGEVFGIEFKRLTSKETEMRFKVVVDAHLDSSS